MANKAFATKNGVGIEQVREMLTDANWVIERDKAYKCRRWILRDKNSRTKTYRIRYNPTMGEMFTELSSMGISHFASKYEATTDGKTAKVRKKLKITKKEIKAKKKKIKANGPKLAALQDKHIDTIVKRMKIGISEKLKKKLKLELLEIRTQIADLGGVPMIGKVPMFGDKYEMNAEEMNEARRRGAEKRKETKAKKDKDKKNAASFSKGSGKSKKSKEDGPASFSKGSGKASKSKKSKEDGPSSYDELLN